MDMTMQPALSLQIDPAFLKDEAYHLRLPDGGTAPLFMTTGEPVRSFVAGWSPTLLFTGFDSISVLVFEGPDEVQASWLLDADHVRVGDSLASLPPEIRQAFQDQALPLLQTVLRDLLATPAPSSALGQVARLVARLDRPLRLALADALSDQLVTPARMMLAEALPTSLAVATADGA